MIKYLTMTIEKQKNIALIAHDGKKQDMLKWCMDNKEILQQHNLSGTGTTARMIADHVMIHSTLMNEQYSHQIENFKNTVDVRVKEMPSVLNCDH